MLATKTNKSYIAFAILRVVAQVGTVSDERSIVIVSYSERSFCSSFGRAVNCARDTRKKLREQRTFGEKERKRRREERRKTSKEEGDAVANGHRMWSNLREMRTGRTAREEELETR